MATPERPPNVVLVVADDLGYGDVGTYSDDGGIPTPNIDAIAGEGLMFTDAHSTGAVCTQSRYGLLTGKYHFRTDRRGRGVVFDYTPPLIGADQVTLPGLLRRSGYYTACLGKWHLGIDWTRTGNRDPAATFDSDSVDFRAPYTGGPTDRGFDRFFGLRASLDMPPYCYLEDDHTVGVPAGEKDRYHGQQRAGPAVGYWRDETVGPDITRRAVGAIAEVRTADPPRPFFLYVPTSAPHRPWRPPSFVRGATGLGPRADMVAEFDWTVGRIVEQLERFGIAGETILIVTSDHGPVEDVPAAEGEHSATNGLRGGKATLYEGGHRVPFVVRWPGVAPTGHVTEPISHIDLLPTIAALTGAGLEGTELTPDGYDVSSLLTGGADGPGPPPTREYFYEDGEGRVSVRRGNWKLVPGDDRGELFDIATDVHETDDRYADQPMRVDRLRAALPSPSG